MPPTALSPTTVNVLKAIVAGAKYGFDIMDATGLPSGTVYPILGRLERGALVRGRWESTAAAQRDKRPPRRYYEVSAKGAKALAHSIEHYRRHYADLTGPSAGDLIPRPSRA